MRCAIWLKRKFQQYDYCHFYGLRTDIEPLYAVTGIATCQCDYRKFEWNFFHYDFFCTVVTGRFVCPQAPRRLHLLSGKTYLCLPEELKQSLSSLEAHSSFRSNKNVGKNVISVGGMALLAEPVPAGRGDHAFSMKCLLGTAGGLFPCWCSGGAERILAAKDVNKTSGLPGGDKS